MGLHFEPSTLHHSKTDIRINFEFIWGLLLIKHVFFPRLLSKWLFQMNQNAPVGLEELFRAACQVLQYFSSKSGEQVMSGAYWPLRVIGCVLWGLFQQRDVDQSTGQNEKDSHSVGSPAEEEREKDKNNVCIKTNGIQATGGLSKYPPMLFDTILIHCELR